jgi:hypothetical protein
MNLPKGFTELTQKEQEKVDGGLYKYYYKQVTVVKKYVPPPPPPVHYVKVYVPVVKWCY